MLRAVEPHGAQVVRAMYSFGEYQSQDSAGVYLGTLERVLRYQKERQQS